MGTQKVVINVRHGGFELSQVALSALAKAKGVKDIRFWYENIQRDDPILIELVETMGDSVNTVYSKLKVVEIPADVEWIIQDYDGAEWVAEKHRKWE